jgi:hypothetical protein
MHDMCPCKRTCTRAFIVNSTLCLGMTTLTPVGSAAISSLWHRPCDWGHPLHNVISCSHPVLKRICTCNHQATPTTYAVHLAGTDQDYCCSTSSTTTLQEDLDGCANMTFRARPISAVPFSLTALHATPVPGHRQARQPTPVLYVEAACEHVEQQARQPRKNRQLAAFSRWIDPMTSTPHRTREGKQG